MTCQLNLLDHLDVLHDQLIEALRELLDLQCREDLSSEVRLKLRECSGHLRLANEAADAAFYQEEDAE